MSATNTNGISLQAYSRRGTLAKHELLAAYAPKAVTKAFRDITTAGQALALCRDKRVVTLSALSRDHGEEKAEIILRMQLVELNDLLGLKSPMTVAQIEAASAELLRMYPYMSIADINIVLGRIKRGECGKLYDRLTMPQLMQFFSEYNDERCEEAARQSRAEAESCRWEHEREDKGCQAWHNALKASLMAAVKTREAETKANSDGK